MSGQSVRSATLAASRLRTDSGCASCTTLSPTIAPYTRHAPRSVRSVEKPSSARGAIGARGCEKYISTPLRFQIWITIPSSPFVCEPSTCENGSDGSAAAICCS